MCLATVLVPAFNCSGFINECLDSILNQSFTDYEIIIIDDGSTDTTLKQISEYNDKRIRVIKNDNNRGIVYSLNLGIDHAEGKYIVRMDADDIMLGDRIKQQIDFLEANLEFGLVGSTYNIIDKAGNFKKHVKLVEDPSYLKLGILFRNQFHHSAITMRTELVRKLRYSEDFLFCEDHDLWIRFSEIVPIANLSATHLAYRWHQNNTCHVKQMELRQSVIGLLSRELDKLKVEHSSRELVLHSAVSFGLSRVFFNTPEKKLELQMWYDKLFACNHIKHHYDAEWLTRFRQQIVKQYEDRY